MKRIFKWGRWSLVAGVLAVLFYFLNLPYISLVLGIAAIGLGLFGFITGGIGKKALAVIGIALGAFISLVHAGIIPFA